MKKLSKFIDIILYIIVGIVLTASITSAIWDKPMILSSVRSNSMYPLFERSDMIFIKSVSEEDTVDIGDIVVFKVEEGSGSLSSQGWIVHRIIDGDENSGYITKGDANDYVDQSSGKATPIQRSWIVSKVITFKGTPLKFPLLGYLSLWMDDFQTNPYIIPIIVFVLVGIVAFSELTSNKKRKKKKKSSFQLHLIYLLGGITITIIMGSTMLVSSGRTVLSYNVSENSGGVLMGSDIGIMKIGEEITKPLPNLNNEGLFPIIATITTKDDQINLSHKLILLNPGDKIETEMELKASKVGSFNTIIQIGIFYPLLPGKLIYFLANISYWLALAVVSLLPGLPLMLYPLIDGSMRRKTIKEIRRLTRRITRFIPLFN